MPTLKKIRDNMKKQKISSEIMTQMDFEVDCNDSQNIITLIDKMDRLLTKEQCLSIMEKQGCCKGGERDSACKSFGIRHKDKTLSEKLEALKIERLQNSGLYYIFPPILNNDGSLTLSFSGYQNGIHIGKNTCSCGTIKKLKQPFSVSPTYCGCCAGHFLYHYQNVLGIKLKLKEINSTPLNTNCEMPCSFTFEIIN